MRTFALFEIAHRYQKEGRGQQVLSMLRDAYEASQAIEDDPTSKEIERSLQD